MEEFIIRIPKQEPLKSLSRFVFINDKKMFEDIARKVNLNRAILLNLCIDDLIEYLDSSEKSELSITPTDEATTKFLFNIYESDIDRINKLMKRDELRGISFCYVFREIIRALEKQI